MTGWRADGARDLSRALRAAGRDVRLELNRQVKPAALLVATQAKENAVAQGFAPPGRSGRGTGQLLRGIKASVRSGVGYVRESAMTSRGFPYPAVYEFGGDKHRAFIVPAVEQKRLAVEAMLAGAVERALKAQDLT